MVFLRNTLILLFFSVAAVAQIDTTGILQTLVFQECVNNGIKFRVKPLTPQLDDDYLVKMENVSKFYNPNFDVNFARIDKNTGFFSDVYGNEQAHLQISIIRKGYPVFSYKAYSTTCDHSGLPTNCPENTRELSIDRLYPGINQLINVEWHGDFQSNNQFLNWYNNNTSNNPPSRSKLFSGVLMDYPAVFHAQPSQRNQECHGWTELHIDRKQPLVIEPNLPVSITDFQTYLTMDTLDTTLDASVWTFANIRHNANVFGQCKRATNFFGNSALSATSVDIGADFSIGMWLNATLFNQTDSLGSVLISYLDDVGAKTDGFSIGLNPAGNIKLIARKNNITVNGSDGNVEMTSNIPLNQWKYLTFTYDGNDLKVFVNGTLTSRKRVGIGTPAAKKLKIGDSIFGQHGFVGKIDDIKIFNRSLSEADVINLWQHSSQHQPLESTLILDAIVTGNKTEEASFITSTERIEEGEIFYKAYKSIDLTAGFDSDKAAVFEAKVAGCDNL